MKQFGSDGPCYIIAEAGSNHDGDLDQAKELIAVAAEAGADAIKFQMFKAARLYTERAGPSAYLGRGESIVDIVRAMEMPEAWLPILSNAAREAGLDFMISAFDEESLETVDPFVAVHKCASYEMTHLPLVRTMARTSKPLIVSTGTASLEEVAVTLEAARGCAGAEIVLLQCTAAYPTPLADVNVRAMLALASLGTPVGLSDHSRDPVIAPSAAVSLGACVVEKHFTLSNHLDGPDHRFALEPDELCAMVRAIRATERALGDGRKEPRAVESELREFARRSIFTTREITKGEPLSTSNLAVLRCGVQDPGLPPDQWERVLGRIAVRDLASQTGLRSDDVGP